MCATLVHDGSSRCVAHKVLPGRFADKHRGSRHERGYGNQWVQARERVMRRDGGLCQPCKAEGILHAGTEVDHIVPKAEGGTDDDANLQTICKARHRAKTQAEAARARGLVPAPMTQPRPAQARPCALLATTEGGAGQKSSAPAAGTDRLDIFSCAGVLTGGVPLATAGGQR